MRTQLGGRWLAATLCLALASSIWPGEREIHGVVTSVDKETRAACDDCQMRVEITGGAMRAGDIVLVVTPRAHNVAPGSKVRIKLTGEKAGDSGAYVRGVVTEVQP